MGSIRLDENDDLLTLAFIHLLGLLVMLHSGPISVDTILIKELLFAR